MDCSGYGIFKTQKGIAKNKDGGKQQSYGRPDSFLQPFSGQLAVLPDLNGNRQPNGPQRYDVSCVALSMCQLIHSYLYFSGDQLH